MVVFGIYCIAYLLSDPLPTFAGAEQENSSRRGTCFRDFLLPANANRFQMVEESKISKLKKRESGKKKESKGERDIAKNSPPSSLSHQ